LGFLDLGADRGCLWVGVLISGTRGSGLQALFDFGFRVHAASRLEEKVYATARLLFSLGLLEGDERVFAAFSFRVHEVVEIRLLRWICSVADQQGQEFRSGS